MALPPGRLLTWLLLSENDLHLPQLCGACSWASFIYIGGLIHGFHSASFFFNCLLGTVLKAFAKSSINTSACCWLSRLLLISFVVLTGSVSLLCSLRNLCWKCRNSSSLSEWSMILLKRMWSYCACQWYRYVIYRSQQCLPVASLFWTIPVSIDCWYVYSDCWYMLGEVLRHCCLGLAKVAIIQHWVYGSYIWNSHLQVYKLGECERIYLETINWKCTFTIFTGHPVHHIWEAIVCVAGHMGALRVVVNVGQKNMTKIIIMKHLNCIKYIIFLMV